MANENFWIEIEGTGESVSEAFADITQNLWKEVYNEYASEWIPGGHILNNAWLWAVDEVGGEPYGYQFEDNLNAADTSTPGFTDVFQDGQQVGEAEQSTSYWSDDYILTYKYLINIQAWRNALESFMPPGQQNINNLIIADPDLGGAPGNAPVLTDLDVPVEGEQDDRPVPSSVAGGALNPTKSGKTAVDLVTQMQADAANNTVETASTTTSSGATIPGKKLVFLDAEKYDATHVVVRRGAAKRDKTKLRSKPQFLSNKAKPWVRLKNQTLVKIIRQNIGKRGKFHEVEVKSGEFSENFSNSSWPLTTKVNTGYVKVEFLRPLAEGLLFPIKEVAGNTDVRKGQADSVPTEWRKREIDVPVLITKQNEPWESRYEIVLRSKQSNFGSEGEEQFLRKYKIIGILKMLRYYNKAFQDPAPSEERMAELLADTSFCDSVEWHLDTTTKNSKILVCVRVLAKFLDRYPTRLEDFDFDKVRESVDQVEDARFVEDQQGTMVTGTKKQVQKAATSKEAEKTLGIDSITSEPGITKIIDFVPSFSLACKYGDLKSNIETLKEMLGYYEGLVKKDKENRIATFPNGPIRGPLDFQKEIKNLDSWSGAIKNFLSNNDYDYHGEPCADGTKPTTPKNASDEDILEFGWNSDYQLIYVLFNGFPLRIGVKYFAERSAFKFRRTNHLIHNAFDVHGDNTIKQTKDATPTDENEAPNQVAIAKQGTVSQYKQQPEKRMPWTEWVMTNIYRDAEIRPSHSKSETPNKSVAETKEQEYGEGPYTQEEVDKQEEKDKNADDKIEVNQEAESTTFETIDAFVQDIENVVDKIEELEDAFYYLLDKVGLRPLVDALMTCLMKQIPSAEEMAANLGLKAIFKDLQEAIQFIGDLLNSAPAECAMIVLQEALELVYEEHPQQEVPGLEDFQEKVAEDAAKIAAESENTDDLNAAIDQMIVAMRTSSIKSLFPDEKHLLQLHGINYKFKNDKDVVKEWQQRLVDSDLYAIAAQNHIPALPPESYAAGGAWENTAKKQVDGIFGPRTEAATLQLLERKYVLKSDMPTEATSASDSSGMTEAPSDPESPAAQENPNKVIMSNGSKDKKKGLKNHVTIWQQFLVSEGFLLLNEDDENYIQGPRRWTGADFTESPDSHNLGTGQEGIKQTDAGKYRFYYMKDGNLKNTKFGIDGIFGWRTTAATKNWLTWVNQHGLQDPEPAPGEMIVEQTSPWAALDPTVESYDGEVTQEMYNIAAAYMKQKQTSKESGKSIDTMAGVDIANRVKFLGPRPPAGYYCRLGKPGPCDEIYSKIVKISRQIAVIEMSSEPADLGKLMKQQNALKVEYVNCMKSAESEPVIGEGKDHWTGKEGTADDQEKELATSIVVAEGTCDNKRIDLINALNGTTIWPGDDAATGEQHDALKAYLECVNKEVTDKRQKIMKSGGVALEGVTSIHPFPQSIEEAWAQFRQEGRFPTNVQLKEGFNEKRLWEIFTADDGPCSNLTQLLLDYIMKQVPPAVTGVLNKLIQTSDATGLDAMVPSPPSIPPLPDTSMLSDLTRPTYDPEGFMKDMVEQMVRKILTEIITALVKMLVQMVNEACAENEGAAENFGGLNASDIFSGQAPSDSVVDLKIPDFEDLQNRLNKLQAAVNDWGLPFDVIPGGSLTRSGSPGGDPISYWDVLDSLSKILKPSQLCELFSGNGSLVIMAAVREYLDERFPEVSMMLPTQEDLKDFLKLVGKYADPTLCKEVRKGNFANPRYVPGGKLCVPEMIRERQLSQCLESGLTEEQCKEMQKRRDDSNIENVAKLANWPENIGPNSPSSPAKQLCEEIAEMKANLPSVETLLNDVFKALLDTVTMVFNGETGYFVPALMQDGNLMEIGPIEKIPGMESLTDILKGDASPEELVNAICEGVTTAYQSLDTDPDKLLETAEKSDSPYNQKTKAAGEAFKDEDGDHTTDEQDVDEDDYAAKFGPGSGFSKRLKNLGLAGGTDSETGANFLSQIVGATLRKLLRNPASFITNWPNSETRFFSTVQKDNIIYNLPDVDGLMDSWGVRINEAGEELIFNNDRFINESVESYVKSQFEDEWPVAIGESGPFDGDHPPQAILFQHIVKTNLLESGYLTAEEIDNELTTNRLVFYHAIKDALIFRIRRQISNSKFFERDELTKINLTPTTKEAKDECGIPLKATGDVDVVSLLRPKKYLDEAKESYKDALMEECEKGPGDAGAEGPLEEAIAEMTTRCLLRTFAVEAALNSLFVITQFRVKDCLNEKVMLGYTMHAFKQDMLARKIYSKTKEVAKRIIRKKRKRGDEFIPTNLRTGYDCLMFLLQEEIIDVTKDFEKILSTVLETSKLPSWEQDGFNKFFVIGKAAENIGIFPYDLACVNEDHDSWDASFGTLPRLMTFDMDNRYIGSGWIGNMNHRFGTFISHETLGFDSRNEAAKFYDFSMDKSTQGIPLRKVLDKHGAYIWEPYLYVKEPIYDSATTSPPLTAWQTGPNDIIEHTHPKFLQRILHLDFTKAASGGSQNFLNKITMYDMRWNSGLTGYVDIERFGEYLSNVKQTLSTYYNYAIESGMQIDAPFNMEMFEEIQAIDQFESSVGGQSYNSLNEHGAFKDMFPELRKTVPKELWPITQHMHADTALNAILVDRLPSWPFYDNYLNEGQTEKGYNFPETGKNEFINWWTVYVGIEKATEAWAQFNSLFKNLEVTREYKQVMYWTPNDTAADVSPNTPECIGLNEPLCGLGSGGPGSIYYAYQQANLNSNEWHAPPGGLTGNTGPWLANKSNWQGMIDLLRFQRDGVPYDNVWPAWLDWGGGGGTNGALVAMCLQPGDKTGAPNEFFQQWDLSEGELSLKSWPNVTQHTVQYGGIDGGQNGGDGTGDVTPQAHPLGFEGAQDFRWYAHSWKGHMPEWKSATETCSYGWTPAALDALNHIIRWLMPLGDHGLSMWFSDDAASGTLVAPENSVFYEMFMNLQELDQHYNSTFHSMVNNLGYFEEIRWGLRLSYVFNEDTPNMGAIKDIIDTLHDNYNTNGPLSYRDANPVNGPNQPVPEDWTGPWPYGLEKSDLSPHHGAPKISCVEIDNPEWPMDWFGTTAQDVTPKKIYSIPLAEAEMDALSTQLGTLRISDIMKPSTSLQWMDPPGGTSEHLPDSIPIVGGSGQLKKLYYEEAFEALKAEIVGSEQYAAIFDYSLPFKRYLSINTVNVQMAMKKMGPGPLMYVGTRDVLTSILLGALGGKGADSIAYKDPQLQSLGGAAGSFSDQINPGTGGMEKPELKEINIAAMAIKMFLETPLHILKGLVEQFDPNISIIKKITDALKIIVEMLPDIAPECVVEEELQTAIDSWNNLPEDVKNLTPYPSYDEIKQKASGAYMKVKEEIRNILNSIPVPYLSIMLLPSQLPYGCGFPAPPWGPGIGPPLTPWGVTYLILGLYKDRQLMPTPDLGVRKRGKGVSPSDFGDMSMDLDEACRDKLIAYQEAAARGLLIDADPLEEDSD